MRRKLFVYLLLIGLLASFLCCGCMVAVMVGQSERQTFGQLAQEAMLAAQGYQQQGDEWLSALPTELRLTHVSPTGQVLFDNQANPAEMGNHLDREEIVQALDTGRGQTMHQSETLLERTLYYALRLEDGSVLRVACTQSSALSAVLESLPVSALVLLVMAALCVPLAAPLATQLVRPINAVNLDDPKATPVYPELTPLVERIDHQNRTIRGQMEHLRQRQREFTAITENMSEGFLLLSPHLEILSGNPAAFRLLGMEDTQRPLLLRRDCPVPRMVSAAESALSGIRDEAVLPFGDMLWQMIASPVSADGQIFGAVVLLLDVTERERREALRMEFSANVSHELKTPLTSISGYAELMKEGLLPPEKTRDAATIIYQESQRLIALIGDIIKLSQLDEAQSAPELEPVDLYRLAAETLEALRNPAALRHVTLTLHGSSQTVPGIPPVLREMLYNLCDNAIQYNVEGGAVEVTVAQHQRHVQLIVQDTGIGIPYQDQPRIFERFYRVDKSRSRQQGGTGLGLSIVKHAAQLHHATIELQSHPGKGTAFIVTF